jgi:CHAT domain-containing protein
MNRPITLFLFLLFISLLYSQDKVETRPPYIERFRVYDRYYREAELLSLRADYNEKTAAQEIDLNRKALDGFRSLLPVIEKEGNDSIAFHCYYRIGTLEHYFDSLESAMISYQRSIRLGNELSFLADSFLFHPYLFAGSLFYEFNQFDSAILYYQHAEQINNQYPVSLNGANRLYNMMGALFYEMGNYKQARNYFEKSISTLSPSESFYRDLLNNYRINLASTLNKLEEYDKADAIYQELFPSNINRNEILHNMGTIRLNTGGLRKAIELFKQVDYTNNRIIRLYNDIGYTYSNLGKPDSALFYFEKALEENLKWNGSQKTTAHGQTLKYLGDEMADARKYQEAARYYQDAIIQFYMDFHDSNLFNNPTRYSGVFSYIPLFHALIAKGDVMEKWYHAEKKRELLQVSLQTYQSAYRLADYVERIYDSDESRLFLNKIKHTVHSKPIDVSILLFELTKDKAYLETAYQFDQQNKASVLSLNITSQQHRNEQGNQKELLLKEASLRSTITTLSLKASQTSDSATIHALNASIRDLEIQLGRMQDQINENPDWRQRKFIQRIPSTKRLQQALDEHTALLSYHLSLDNILLLLITDNRFEYFRIPLAANFIQQVEDLRKSLTTMSTAEYEGALSAKALYATLVKPVEKSIPGIDRLIIVPDDELHYFPFEALQDEQEHYLVQRFSIQYLYSTALFDEERPRVENELILAMAPFASFEFHDTTGNDFSRLRSSKEEVENLKGKVLLDSAATKSAFLSMASQYDILHLATHAQSDNEDPLRSYIAFYPGGKEFKLYAAEIYNLDLRSTRLLILSACETGAGQLIKGEGILSLSRAFAYAGCSNVITSLWKAEDRTTAYITQRLHYYLEHGYTRDHALRQAKLDLLGSNNIGPRFKTPNYWAHLIYIGQYEPSRSSNTWWWVAGSFLLLGITTWWIKRRKRRIAG